MNQPPCKVKLSILELESAFESVAAGNSAFHGESGRAFLEIASGEISYVEAAGDTEKYYGEEFIHLPNDLFDDVDYDAMDDFVTSLPDSPMRSRLSRAIQGKGAFRRFKDIVFGGGDVELKRGWQWFMTRRKRERISEWLREENIEPDWGADIFQAPSLPDKRADLLRAVLVFVRRARALPGVRRISLVGSLATSKRIPKDVDLLVEVEDGAPLSELAAAKRRLQGAVMKTGDGCGTDVFLCDPQGNYLGRICPWKSCAPGIRQGCEADHCAARTYLYDDLSRFRLDPSVISEPALRLWPETGSHGELPNDVRELLAAPLQGLCDQPSSGGKSA